MRSLSHFFLWIVAFAFVMLGCEKHSFETTQTLHQEHGGGHGDHGDDHHGHEDGHGHGDDHHGHDDKKAHEEKKGGDAHGEEKKDKPAKEEPRDTGI